MMVEKFELAATAPEQVRFANLLLKQPLRLVSDQVTCHQLRQISKPQGSWLKLSVQLGNSHLVYSQPMLHCRHGLKDKGMH